MALSFHIKLGDGHNFASDPSAPRKYVEVQGDRKLVLEFSKYIGPYELWKLTAVGTNTHILSLLFGSHFEGLAMEQDADCTP